MTGCARFGDFLHAAHQALTRRAGTQPRDNVEEVSRSLLRVVTVLGRYAQDTATSTAITIVFLLAATQAANGRDAALFAPSLPPRSLRARPATGPPQRETTDDITTAVAGLSRLLASRLAATATIAVAAADRAACHDAAGCARQVSDLLTGENP